MPPGLTRWSTEGAKQLLVRRELPGRLLRIGEPAVHRDLEHAAAALLQAHLRGRLRLQDRLPRRTGARLIASHTAVFDFDLHGAEFSLLMVTTEATTLARTHEESPRTDATP